jgi:YnbE-like lipoprotein
MNRLFSNTKAMICEIRNSLTNRMNNAIRQNMGKNIFLCAPLTTLLLSGCIQVQAPDKPIVINLNIAIRQDVIVSLDQASKKIIEENKEIF